MPKDPSPVLLVEETLRQYRIPFYEALHDELEQSNRRLLVAFSPAMSRAEGRRDAVVPTAPWAIPTPFSQVARIGSRTITYQSLTPLLRALEQPLVIANQAVAKAENYRLAWLRARGHLGFATWGHGKTYSVGSNATLDAVKRSLTRRSDWFFAYTNEGAEHVASYGFPASRITTVRNTIDIGSLRSDLSSVIQDDVAAFRRRYNLVEGSTALYMGGVDERKGISFLLEAAQYASQQIPDFALLVGGAGNQVDRVTAAQRQGLPVRYLGRIDGAEKALALRAADVLAIPEWVGLVAVDSLVAGRPIVTTDHWSHSCEFEYLKPEHTCFISAHTPADYATALVGALTNEHRLRQVQDKCLEASEAFSLELMVSAFRDGIESWDELRQCALTGRAKHPHGSPIVTRSTKERCGPDSIPARPEVAVLMACHNRADRTLQCLASLASQDVHTAQLTTYLVDDRSTDGTSAAVRAVYPDVRVLEGSGILYWAGAMSVAEREAVQQRFDAILWLNDDVTLKPDAIQTLMDCWRTSGPAIVVGATEDPVTGVATYGALARVGRHPMKFRLISPGGPTRPDAFNGNIALIPFDVRESVGPIDGALGHAYADLDYGLRATTAQQRIVQPPRVVGYCTVNAGLAMPARMIDRWRTSQSPLYQPWRSQVRFLRRHGGLLWPLYLLWGYTRILLGWRA